MNDEEVYRGQAPHEEVVRLLEEDNVDGALKCLRDSGDGKISSIRFLMEHAGYTYRHAKEAVDHSAVWRDVGERDARFHENAIRTVDQQCDQEPPHSGKGK